MKTKRQEKREQRQRDKDARKRYRQEAEWRKHRKLMRAKTTDELRAEIEVLERKHRSIVPPMTLASVIVTSVLAQLDRRGK